MDQDELLQAMVPLVADLSRQIPESERYERLLSAMRALVPADAAAILQLDGDALIPLAINGLVEDTLGRRFRVQDHPRFSTLLAASSVVKFTEDCGLPDPYDGLVAGISGVLTVHDCMGCALKIDDRVWGLITLDALAVNTFKEHDLAALKAFAGLAAATVRVAKRMDDLAVRAEVERQRAEGYEQVVKNNVGRRSLFGQSTAHKTLLKEIGMVGPTELMVLITGETGVGKELVAAALHAASPRSSRPMVSLNCAALPENLVESELFGHVRGAFSGAVSDRRGKFEVADGGTLFLDEVGELPLSVQAKLLRVLQEGQLQRLGSDREHKVNVRLIAATNRDLAAEVKAGRFRVDLYHRMSVYPLRVPSLKERSRDVLMLAGYFLEENRGRLGVGSVRLDPDAQTALVEHDWPGNVRELEHLIGRASIRALGRNKERPRVLTIAESDLGLETKQRGDFAALQPQLQASSADDGSTTLAPKPEDKTSLREALQAYERAAITASLARHGGRWASAARDLGMDRANLARRAKGLGLAPFQKSDEGKSVAEIVKSR